MLRTSSRQHLAWIAAIGHAPGTDQGAPQEDAEAEAQLRQAALRGDAFAAASLGHMYAVGRDVPQNPTEAVIWFRRAAEQGNAFGETFLGYMHATGQGVTKDSAEAVKWYRRAAERGHDGGQFCLGGCYAKGDGVAQDFVQAYVWYNLAVAQGNQAAARGRDFVTAHMTPEQIAEAQRLSRAMSVPASPPPRGTAGQNRLPTVLHEVYARAREGDAEAQWTLGTIYAGGDGMPRDYAEAARWLLPAAEQGHAAARVLLGWMYRKGEGVPKDDALALMWWELAAGQGDTKAAAARDSFALTTTPGQLAEAERMVAERMVGERNEAAAAAPPDHAPEAEPATRERGTISPNHDLIPCPVVPFLEASIRRAS